MLLVRLLYAPASHAPSHPQVHEDKVAASATCQNSDCDEVALKLINFSSYTQARRAALRYTAL